MSQMMQRLNKILKGETENFDNVGNTVESEIQAKKQALYDLEYPLALVYRSIEAEQTPHQRKVVSSSISVLKGLSVSLLKCTLTV
ncbi:hypothetical protein [Parablautia muri]|nr:hypothetical protein [Parablautia muri]